MVEDTSIDLEDVVEKRVVPIVSNETGELAFYVFLLRDSKKRCAYFFQLPDGRMSVGGEGSEEEDDLISTLLEREGWATD